MPTTSTTDIQYQQTLNRAYEALKVPELKQELISADNIAKNGSLKTGAKNADQVKALQAALNVFLAGNELPEIKVTGKYDRDTARAVKALQGANGIRKTGIYDGDTASCLTGEKMELAQIREAEKYKDYQAPLDPHKSRFFKEAEKLPLPIVPGSKPATASRQTPDNAAAYPQHSPTQIKQDPPVLTGGYPPPPTQAATGYPPSNQSGSTRSNGVYPATQSSSIDPQKLDRLRIMTARGMKSDLSEKILNYTNALSAGETTNIERTYTAMKEALVNASSDRQKATELFDSCKQQGHAKVVDALIEILAPNHS